jgi:hypothetical protein
MSWIALVVLALAVLCFLVETFAPRPRKYILLPLGLALATTGVALAFIIQSPGWRVIVH